MVHIDVFRRGSAYLTKTGLDAVYNREAPVIFLVDRQDVAHIVVSVAVFLNPAVIELAVLQTLLRLVGDSYYSLLITTTLKKIMSICR